MKTLNSSDAGRIEVSHSRGLSHIYSSEGGVALLGDSDQHQNKHHINGILKAKPECETFNRDNDDVCYRLFHAYCGFYHASCGSGEIVKIYLTSTSHSLPRKFNFFPRISYFAFLTGLLHSVF